MDKEKGYRNDYFWVPKAHIQNVGPVKRSLMFEVEQGTPVYAYTETADHLGVPREYIPFESWEKLPYAVVNNEKTDFPRISVRPLAKLRDEIQRISHQSLLEGGNGILSVACGVGKTVISLIAWTDLKTPGLVVVHTKDLRDQWVDRIVEHTSLSRDDVGIYQGTTEDWKKPICVAMIQTLASRASSSQLPEGFSDHFGVVIYDEVHHLGAPYFNSTAAIGKGLRWGLSATPEREDGLDALYQYHIGPILYQNLEQDIIPDTYFTRMRTQVPVEVLPSLRDRTGELNIPKLMTWLAKDKARNENIIANIKGARDEGRKILVLSSRVEHLEELRSAFGDEAGIIHGKVSDKDRKGVLQTRDIVFATTQLAKEGLDRKDLDTIFLVLPISREGMFRQILGRIQRRSEGKQTPVMLIFEDHQIPVCLHMCRKLRKHLRSFGYPFSFIKD